MSRCTVNVIIPGRVYQRGQIMTWPRAQKQELFKTHGISWVVNLWPKMDADLVDTLTGGYLYLPVADSENVRLDPRVARLAQSMAREAAEGNGVLVLCEAGVTRSVFFAALMVRALQGTSGADALQLVEASLPRIKLRPTLRSHLRGLPPVEALALVELKNVTGSLFSAET